MAGEGIDPRLSESARICEEVARLKHDEESAAAFRSAAHEIEQAAACARSMCSTLSTESTASLPWPKVWARQLGDGIATIQSHHLVTDSAIQKINFPVPRTLPQRWPRGCCASRRPSVCDLRASPWLPRRTTSGGLWAATAYAFVPQPPVELAGAERTACPG